MDNKGEPVPATTTDDVERFDRWASTYDRSLLQKLLFQPVHTKMLDLIMREGPNGPPHRIIDVGCGTGRLLRAAASRWPEAHLFGVDPAEHMVLEARRLNPESTFKLAAAESLPFPDGTADLVLSSLSFHHWADQNKALQEIARVLRTGGWFCLADHTFQLARLFGEKVISRNQLRALIADAGMKVHRHWRTRFILVTLAQKCGKNNRD